MIPHLGTFHDAEHVIQVTGVQHVMVIAPGLKNQDIQNIVYRVQPLVKKVAFIPDMGSLPLATLETNPLIDGRVISLSFRNNLALWYNRAIKRTFDLLCTLIGIICLSPFFLAVACGFVSIRRGQSSSNIDASVEMAKNLTAINSAACVLMPTSS